MGRQPWIVHPNPDHAGDPRTELIRMTVDMGVSDHAPATVIITLVGFTLLYLILAVVWFWLIRRAVIAGPPTESAEAINAFGNDPEHAGPSSPIATDLGAIVSSPVRFNKVHAQSAASPDSEVSATEDTK